MNRPKKHRVSPTFDEKTVAIEKRKPKAGENRCRACGETLPNRRRRYCSDDCRATLKRELWFSEALLRALNSRFATFRWTETKLILQVLPDNGAHVFCFFYKRTPGARPAVDLRNMTIELGEKWWKERKSTSSRYGASERVLQQADVKKSKDTFSEFKRVTRIPKGVSSKSLSMLKIATRDLLKDNAEEVIKRAFKKQAMRTHPDRGGSDRDFIGVKRAFDELNVWIEDPVIEKKRQVGLPDSWVFDRSINRWYPPKR